MHYLNKLIQVDSILQTRAKNLSNTFTQEYDIPNLLAEKEALIAQLEGTLSTAEKVKYSALAGALGIFLLLLYQMRKRKILKQRFTALQNSLQTPKKQLVKKLAVEPLQIPTEIVNKVLKNLAQFEKKQGFTDTSLTLAKLASLLETNSSYLSKIINSYKNVNFSNYLTDLRITHTLNVLEKNKALRKYTIKAIAEEVGFNNAESFAKAFYKKTGLKPSYYIKELEKVKVA